jgi:CrcB protein
MLNTVGLVALGGAIGAVLRYSVIVSTIRIFGAGFPMGTMVVNVAGSFLMGIAAAILLQRGQGTVLVPFLMVGVLGGFTTFSAFSMDAMALVEKGRMISAAVYVLGSVSLSILALFLGLTIARSIWS